MPAFPCIVEAYEKGRPLSRRTALNLRTVHHARERVGLEGERVAHRTTRQKGADRIDNADSREKRNIGARLQEVSDGTVVFLGAELDRGGGVARQIDVAIG